MLSRSIIALFLLFFSHFILAGEIHYVVLNGDNNDSYESSLFEQAALVFSDAFIEAYADLSLEELGWAGDARDSDAVKRAVFQKIIHEDHQLYLSLLGTKEAGDYLFIFARFDNQVVGYRSMKNCSGGIIYSRQGAVDPSFQRRGISSALLKKYSDVWPGIKTIYVCTRTLNPKSGKFWTAIGFEECPLEEVNVCAQTDYSAKHFVGYKKVVGDR